MCVTPTFDTEPIKIGLDNVRTSGLQLPGDAASSDPMFSIYNNLKNVNKDIKTPTDTLTLSEAKAATQDIKKLKRIRDTVKNRLSLDLEDERTVSMLLKGKLSLENIKGDKNYDAIKKMYEASKPVFEKEKILKDVQRNTRAGYDNLATDVLQNSDAFKEKKMGLQYSRETPERNFIDVAGKKDGQKIVDEYITPIHQNEAVSTRMKRDIRDEVRNLNISTKKVYKLDDAYKAVAKGLDTSKPVSESTLLQLYGENLISKAGLRKIGADVDKISAAAEKMRGIYNNLIEAANNQLIKHGYEGIEYRQGYFPHFEENKADGALGKIAKKLGIDNNIDELPTDIAGLTHTFRPGKKWFGNALSRKGESTTYDALKGLDLYLEGVSDIIHHTSDIQKLRSLETNLRLKYSDEGIKERVKEILDSEADEVLKQQGIDKILKAGDTHLSSMATWLRNYTDNLAGKKSIADRVIEYNLGRTFYNVSKAVENRVAANMIALNPGSWLTNYIPIVQAAGVSNKNLIKGMAETVQNYFKKDGFENASTFLTNRVGSEPLWKSSTERVQNFLSRPMGVIDEFTSNTLTRAMYKDAIEKGLPIDEAIKKADSFAASVIADRSNGALPTVFNSKNPLTKIFTMYQVEVNNQWSHLLKDIPRNSESKMNTALAFTKYAVAAYVFNDIYESIVGRRPALDPISWVNDFVGDTTGTKVPNFADVIFNDEEADFNTEKKKASGTLARFGENVAESLPFIGGVLGGGRVPVQSALPSISALSANTADLLSGDKNQGTALRNIGKELLKPATYIVPPVGGGQIKKVAENALAMAKGGAYGYDAEGKKYLKYSIDPSAENIVKGSLFGPYSTKKAREYINSDFKRLSAKKTAAYDSLVKSGMKNSKAEEFMRGMPTTEKAAREYLLKSDLTVEQKNEVGKQISKKAYNYASEAMYELSSLPKDSQKQIRKIAKKANAPIVETLAAYNVQKEYSSGTSKALAMLNASDEKLIKKFDISNETMVKAKTLKKANVTASDFEKSKKRADKDKNGGVKISEAESYLNKRKDLTRFQKFAMMKAMTGCKDWNNPFY